MTSAESNSSLLLLSTFGITKHSFRFSPSYMDDILGRFPNIPKIVFAGVIESLHSSTKLYLEGNTFIIFWLINEFCYRLMVWTEPNIYSERYSDFSGLGISNNFNFLLRVELKWFFMELSVRPGKYLAISAQRLPNFL